MNEIDFIKTKDVRTPIRSTELSAGLDFFTPKDFKPIMVLPNTSILIDTGIYVNIPQDTVLEVRNKSSVALQGLIVGAEIIDADYQGEIKIHIINTSNLPIYIHPDKAIAQLLLKPILYPALNQKENKEQLYKEETNRGQKGFGQVTSEYIK